jgi:uncharacterized protein (TIGR03000 family)
MHLEGKVMRPIVLMTALGLGLSASARQASAADSAQLLPATFRVYLPADAQLSIDGHITKSTSTLRLFITPPLERDQDFHYALRAVFTRGDTRYTAEKVVTVRAGRETVVTLGLPPEVTLDATGRVFLRTEASQFDRLSYYFLPEDMMSQRLGGAPIYDFRYGVPYLAWTSQAPVSRAVPMSEQDPWTRAGPSSSNSPYSLGIAN